MYVLLYSFSHDNLQMRCGRHSAGFICLGVIVLELRILNYIIMETLIPEVPFHFTSADYDSGSYTVSLCVQDQIQLMFCWVDF